jgi:hypothetical protein
MSLEFDECALTDHGCEHDCINNLGGYECSCKMGFELHSDGKHCEGNILIINWKTYELFENLIRAKWEQQLKVKNVNK